MDIDLTALLAGKSRVPVEGRPGWTMRLLSAAEVLEARREAGELASDEKERAVCSNACLLSRALEKSGKPVFPTGAAALEGLRLEEIEALAGTWTVFNRAENPSPEDGEERADDLKKAWSTRVMSAFSGACSVCSALCPPRSGRNR